MATTSGQGIQGQRGVTRSRVSAKCPIRPGDACSLCQPGATGPQDCGLVYLVMTDPELREQLRELRESLS